MTEADAADTSVVTTAPDPKPWSLLAWVDSPTGKLSLIAFLVLLLQLPLSMVSSLIAERQERQEAVDAELAQSWGPAQTVAGPVLTVPFVSTNLTPASGPPGTRSTGWLRLPASQLDVTAQLQPETRRRGLFLATVYTAGVDLDGAFRLPQVPSNLPGNQVDIAWDQAQLVLDATDLRGQPGESPAQVGGGAQVQTLEESASDCGLRVTVPAGLSGPPKPGAVLPFQTHLSVRGTRAFAVLPAGRQVTVRMASPAATPGFTGLNPPLHATAEAAGFKADWQVVGTVPVTSWTVDWTPQCERSKADGVGVELLQPVPTYLMVTRAAKYGTLFLVLAFLTYFLFERLARVSIHIVQYGLLGLSVSLFALLLVAVAEPLGFVAGYVVATAAVMGQASLYTLSVVGSRRLAATFAGVLGSLFAFLYVVIRLDSYALLVGSAGVFVALSLLMAVTRRLDWTGRRWGPLA